MFFTIFFFSLCINGKNYRFCHGFVHAALMVIRMPKKIIIIIILMINEEKIPRKPVERVPARALVRFARPLQQSLLLLTILLSTTTTMAAITSRQWVNRSARTHTHERKEENQKKKIGESAPRTPSETKTNKNGRRKKTRTRTTMHSVIITRWYYKFRRMCALGVFQRKPSKPGVEKKNGRL